MRVGAAGQSSGQMDGTRHCPEFSICDSFVPNCELPESETPVRLRVESLEPMRRCLLPLMFVLLLAAAAMAQFIGVQPSAPGVRLHSTSVADLSASQKVLLSNFCRLDFEGARLQAAGWNRMKPFTSLRSNPEFERIVVVLRYDVETVERPTETVRVIYKAVGSYSETEGYTAFSANDHVVFRTQEERGDLMVTEIAPAAPHVSPKAAIDWMNLRIRDSSTSEIERAHLKEAIAELSKLVPQPRAATVAQ